MNNRLNRYVNFLLDGNPSPFCEYIVYKELLCADAQTVRDAYDWAVRFKLYTEVRDEQLPDGSWGGFVDALSTTDAKHRKYKATQRAMNRLADLSLDVSDPLTGGVAELCGRYMSGEEVPLCVRQLPSNNITKKIVTYRDICASLSFFCPDKAQVKDYREKAAEHFTESCRDGRFDFDLWMNTDYNPTVGLFGYEPSAQLLSYGGALDEAHQRMLLNYEWNEREQFGGVRLCEVMTPDKPGFVFWLRAIERLRDFSLFGEYMADKSTPFLYTLCERLSDRDDKIPIYTNKYFPGIGQYSESWNKRQAKKNDLLLRIIRILNKS